MRQQVFQKAAKSLFCARMLKMMERSIQNEKASFNRANIVLCVIYSLFSFFVLALMPLTNPSTIQVAGNLLDMLFIVSLGVFMWQRKNKQNKKHFEA